MGIRFDALSKPEQLAVADHVRRQYESIALLEPETYVSRNAKADPARWQDGLRELIASDPKQVQAITETSDRQSHVDVRGFTLIELSIVLVIIRPDCRRGPGGAEHDSRSSGTGANIAN